MTVSTLLAATLAGACQEADEFQSVAIDELPQAEQGPDGTWLIQRDACIGPHQKADLEARRGDTLCVTSPERDTVIEASKSGWKCIRHQVAGDLESHAWRVHESLTPNDLLPIFDSAHTARAFVMPHVKSEEELYSLLSHDEWHGSLSAVVKACRAAVNNAAQDLCPKITLLAAALRAIALHACAFYSLAAFAEFTGSGDTRLSEEEWLYLLCGFSRIWPGCGLISRQDGETGQIFCGALPESELSSISSADITQLFAVCPFRG